MRNLKQKVLGCIAGGAIGDAFGGPYEGLEGPITVGEDDPWRLSDDTQLTLATCEAIGPAGSVSPETVSARMLAWFREGRLSGLGASTYNAVRDLGLGAHWSLAGRKGEMAAGNGAAMRAAPLAFCLDLDNPDDRTLLRDICWITHHSDEAYVGALALVRSVQYMSSGAWPSDQSLPIKVAEDLPDTSVRDALRVLGEFPKGTSIPELGQRFGCSGFVAESVPLAIFASQRIGDVGFKDLLTEVIAAGGDTDTIASMTAQIAGAWLGLDGIPQALLNRMPDSELILGTAHSLANRLSVPGYHAAAADAASPRS